ncbi:MAG: thioredoxin [Acidimicrobiia bacterium]
MTMTFVKDVDNAAFQSEVVERSKQVPVVVDFWAAWCGPCKVLGPLLEKLAAEFEGGFELAKVDVDSNQALAGRFGVQGIPTVVGFKNGLPVSQFTGALPEHNVRQWLREVVPSEADLLAAAAGDLLDGGDAEAAERDYRQVLMIDPHHTDAAIGLASLLIDLERSEEALALLTSIQPTQEVERLQAAARMGAVDTDAIPQLRERLASKPDNVAVRIELGKALAADQQFEASLDLLLEAVALGGETRDAARQGMLDVFEVIGPENELTVSYRRRLANALF